MTIANDVPQVRTPFPPSMSDQVKQMFTNIDEELTELTHFVEVEEEEDDYFDPFGSMDIVGPFGSMDNDNENIDEDEDEDIRSLALVKRTLNEVVCGPDLKKIRKN